MKSVYALQPYKAGSKRGTSMVVVIPAAVVKEFGISTSSILTLRVDQKAKRFVMENSGWSQETTAPSEINNQVSQP